ncbi:MAG TPA: choice-of-anchor V domain-containing protein [Myxococcales bacterium]|jgi:hypothetical protein
MRCRPLRSIARVLGAIAVLAPSLALAYPGGITGYSGRGGSTCASCHGGGATPTTKLTGPTTLAPGASGTYTLTFTGGPAVDSGLDVAASTGTLATADALTRLASGEITQSSPKAFSGGSASWTFQWTAPATAGAATLYAAGLSSNGSGTSGDGVGSATLAVTVAAAPPPVCTTGQTQSCYTGAAGTLGVGICKAGTQTCSNNAWGACIGQVLPAAAETCSNNLDDNCNGTADEGCPVIICTAGQTQSCYTGASATKGVGTCKAGAQTCSNNAWGACSGQVLPVPEICGDGLDNDCDGIPDDGCPAPVCTAGATQACYSGPAATKGIGACKAGLQTCANNAWGACSGEVLPTAEACGDGIDNDCDGQVDEGCQASVCTEGATQACYSGPAATKGIGACKAGSQTCAGNAWTACSGEVLPATEICGDGLDNDCDGQTDEGCAPGSCLSGSVQSCRVGRRPGSQSCVDGVWSACQLKKRGHRTDPISALTTIELSTHALIQPLEADASTAGGCSAVPGAAFAPFGLALAALALLRNRRR